MRIIFLIIVAFAIVPNSALSDQKKDRPNIAILFADDMGYGDLGLYGGEAKAPTIEQLARESVVFSDFYAAAPVCSPSRAGLLTGLWPMRTGIHTYIRARRPDRDLAEEQVWLKEKFVTLAELLETADYQTAHFGKWHLGAYPATDSHPHPQPSDHGFNYTFGTPNNAVPSHKNPINFYRNGTSVGKLKGFSAQIIVDDAIKQLEARDRDRPFFHYIAFHEPHAPIASPPDLTRAYEEQGFTSEKAEYLANIENMDRAIGNYLTELENAEVRENTIVIFMSDNGPIAPGSSGPFKAEKNFVYEGGIRVPALISGPGMQTGWRDDPVHAVDILPTLVNLIGLKDPVSKNRDGVDISPVLFGESFQREKPMIWFFYRNKPQAAIRLGEYVLIASYDDPVARTHFISEEDLYDIRQMPEKLDNVELYNINKDPEQEENIAMSNPDRVSSMFTLLVNSLSESLQQAPMWSDLPSRENWEVRLQNWPQE